MEPERTPGGRYVVVDGRRWRASNPELSEAQRKALVRELMSARSAVGWAERRRDAEAQRAARERVHAAKLALGERGPKWWDRESSVAGSRPFHRAVAPRTQRESERTVTVGDGAHS